MVVIDMDEYIIMNIYMSKKGQISLGKLKKIYKKILETVVKYAYMYFE